MFICLFLSSFFLLIVFLLDQSNDNPKISFDCNISRLICIALNGYHDLYITFKHNSSRQNWAKIERSIKQCRIRTQECQKHRETQREKETVYNLSLGQHSTAHLYVDRDTYKKATYTMTDSLEYYSRTYEIESHTWALVLSLWLVSMVAISTRACASCFSMY